MTPAAKKTTFGGIGAKRLRIVVAYNARLKRWVATAPGHVRREYLTQADAITASAAIARANQPSELIIKARNGRIRDNRTYGADPRSTKG